MCRPFREAAESRNCVSNGFHNSLRLLSIAQQLELKQIHLYIPLTFPDLYVLVRVQCNERKAVALPHCAVLFRHHNCSLLYAILNFFPHQPITISVCLTMVLANKPFSAFIAHKTFNFETYSLILYPLSASFLSGLPGSCARMMALNISTHPITSRVLSF